MAMVSSKLPEWPPHDHCDYDVFHLRMTAIRVVLHCLTASLRDDQPSLSPAHAQSVRRWSLPQLAAFQTWFGTLDWGGQHVLSDGSSVTHFIHIAAHLLTRDVIDPLIAISSMPGGREAVSKELVDAVGQSWQSALVAYPLMSMSCQCEEVAAGYYGFQTCAHCIRAMLARLRVVVGGCYGSS